MFFEVKVARSHILPSTTRGKLFNFSYTFEIQQLFIWLDDSIEKTISSKYIILQLCTYKLKKQFRKVNLWKSSYHVF